MTEITRLSYTMVRTYLECPRFFYYRYIRGIPAVLDGSLIAGRIYHHGVAFGLKRRKADQSVSVDEVRDVMSDRWEAETKDKVFYEDLGEPQLEARQINWGQDNPGQLKDAALKLGTLYIKTMLPKLQPIAVEERLEGVIGGVPFVGYPDLVVKQNLAGKGVIDHKLSLHPRERPKGVKGNSQELIDKDMQFSAYAALLGESVWASWHQALNLQKPLIDVVTTERKQGDINFFTRIVTEVWKGITSGVFAPNPLCWRCGSERCSYHIECRILLEE
jgi:CRISPR/Cas system-associated exonuclease Cas4 (RecB family)